MSNQIPWTCEPLRNFVKDMGDGGTPSRANTEYFGGDIPWVVITDIQKEIEETCEYLTKKGLSACTAKLWPAGSILLSTGASIGKVGIAKIAVATKQGITGLIPNERITSKFLYYKLLSKTQKLNSWAQGSTFAEIRTPILGKVPLEVPESISVQEKISSILESADQAIEKTESLIAKYQQIKAGLMHDLFTRGVTADGKLRPPHEQAPELYQETPIGWIPKEWQYELLDKLAIRGSGHTPNKNIPAYWNGGVKWISLADSYRLDRLYIDESEYEISQLGIQNSSAVLQPAGIVVLSRDAGVGKSAITTAPMAVSQHFMCWRCDARLDKHFLYYWLQFKKRMFENIAMGSTILTIGLPYFKKLRIAAPLNPGEQTYIGENLKSADEKIFSLEADLEKKQKLKAGLMHDLLTGHVRVA